MNPSMRIQRAAVVVIAMVPALAVALAAAQLPAAPGPPVDPEMRFEVASIKPFDPAAAPRLSMSPGRYDVAGIALPGIISQALRMPPNRITGFPDWSFKALYAISAKAPEGTASTDPRAMFVMVTNLLKDRFKMAMHTESREMPVFHLVFARNDRRFGPAFTESSAECRAAIAARGAEIRRGAVPAGAPGPTGCESARFNPGGTASFSGAPIALLAGMLPPLVGRPVIDKTGLTSYYNFTLKWTPEAGSPGLAPPGLAPPPADPDAPNIFTAVQEQLGLKLESARGPVEVVVIDRLEKPTLD